MSVNVYFSSKNTPSSNAKGASPSKLIEYFLNNARVSDAEGAYAEENVFALSYFKRAKDSPLETAGKYAAYEHLNQKKAANDNLVGLEGKLETSDKAA